MIITPKKLDIPEYKWRQIQTTPKKTLQVFITNQCDRKCRGCFYSESLNDQKMSINHFEQILKYYEKENFERVTLLGGEPTLHKDINKFIDVAKEYNLETTIYTNGSKLEKIKNPEDIQIRIGVHGFQDSEKPLFDIKEVPPYTTIVFMLNRANCHSIEYAMSYAEHHLKIKNFYISSIRDIISTGNYWLDTVDTLSIEEYFLHVQNILYNYNGNLNLHIASRGIIDTGIYIKSCRFINRFPTDRIVACPLDISKEISDNTTHNCTKFKNCVLTKIVLEKL